MHAPYIWGPYICGMHITETLEEEPRGASSQYERESCNDASHKMSAKVR